MIRQNSTPAQFFGDAARPIAQGVMRRHWMAIALYAVVFLLGVVFVLHWYAPNRTEHQLFPGVDAWAIFTWKWSMLIGGGGAVATLCVNPRVSPHWPDLADLLHIEAIFAFLAALGMVVYIVEVVATQGYQPSRQALLVYGVMILGHVLRGIEAVVDAHRLEVLAKRYVTEGTSHGSAD